MKKDKPIEEGQYFRVIKEMKKIYVKKKKRMATVKHVPSSLVRDPKSLEKNEQENPRKKNISPKSSEKEKGRKIIAPEIETHVVDTPVKTSF
jgi:hypothetical protein